MELSDELLEQIGAYLSGRLTTDETARFAARLAQDPALQQEVALQRELKDGISLLVQKDRFKQMHADLDRRGLLPGHTHQADQLPGSQPAGPEPNVVPWPARRATVRYGWAGWVMAASVILAAGVGWLVYTSQREKKAELAQNERVFNAFFSVTLKPVPPLPADPDRLAASPENSRSALDSTRLQTAIQGLPRATLQPVITALRAQSTSRSGHWSASAQWYLALAYLKANQRTQAQPLLETIARLNGHPYQQEARLLLSQLPPSSTTH
ncbi:anti-sigma factor [Fibrella arboris]|uniref:anti-sigma factor n=1 Tax=Fibrella arboris TaxID=3242486 RepID=UPI00352205CE